MTKTPPISKTIKPNTSATEAPVKPADVLAAEAAQAASQAATTEGPANQPNGNEGNIPPLRGAQTDGANHPEAPNTSATEAPVKPAGVLAAEAAQAASQATATEGPASQPDGNEGNIPLAGGKLEVDAKLTDLAITSVQVTSAVEGFRRAGRAWSCTPTTIPFNDLTEEQIIALEKEPLLKVIYLADGEEKQAG